MKDLTIIPFVDWGMGAVIIGVFAVVCVVMALVIYNMTKGTTHEQKKNDTIEEGNKERSA